MGGGNERPSALHSALPFGPDNVTVRRIEARALRAAWGMAKQPEVTRGAMLLLPVDPGLNRYGTLPT